MKNRPFFVGGTLGLILGLILFSAPPLFSWGGHRGMGNALRGSFVTQRYSMMGDVDSSFIAHMIPHHETAIAMAQLALEKSKRPEVRSLAQDIIKAQQKEIADMESWYQKWYGVPVPVVSQGMMGRGMMGGVNGTIDALKNAEDFDVAFMREMIPHHEMAIMMAQMLRGSTLRPEMKQLADTILTVQAREIEIMQSWLDAGF